MATSFIDEFKKARASGISPTQANAAAKKALAASTNNSTSGTPVVTPTPATPAPLTYINNPDGTPVNTTADTTPTNVVTPAPVTTAAPTPLATNTPIANTQTNITPTTNNTNADTATSNYNAATGDIKNTAASEIASQTTITNELGNVDVNQANTKIANANANIAELTANEKAQQITKQANEDAYQESLRQNQGEEIAALKLQQEAENTQNKAEAALLKSKNEKAERDAITANEVAQMQSNVAFAKLGGSFSGAAVNTAQKIFTDGAYNIAVLKSSNAYNEATLAVKINTTAFDHIKAISKLVQDTADKEFDSKERLRSFIGTSQNNILLGKKESQKAIDDAITTYKTEKQTREDKLYADMNAANTRLQAATADIQKSIKSEEEVAKSKIDLMVSNGQWSGLSSAQKNDYERKAGLPISSTTATITTKTTQLINDSLKTIVGKDVAVPTAVLALMQTEVKRAMDLGIGLTQATKMAIDKYKNRIPQVVSAENASKASAALAATKTQAEIDKLKSEATKNNAAATKDIADSKKTGSGGGGGSSTNSNKSPVAFKDGNGIMVQGSVDKQGRYFDSSGKQVTNAQAIYHPNAAEIQQSTWNAIPNTTPTVGGGIAGTGIIPLDLSGLGK